MSQQLVSNKPRRGRPRGSGKDDSLALRKVAELLIDNCDMSTWGAINGAVQMLYATTIRELNVQPDSIVHRINKKWRSQSETILAEVREERHQRQEEQFRNSLNQLFVGLASFGEQLRPMILAMHNQMCAINESLRPAIRAAHEQIARIANDPQIKATFATFASVRIDPKICEAFARIPRLEIDPNFVAALRNVQPPRIDFRSVGRIG